MHTFYSFKKKFKYHLRLRRNTCALTVNSCSRGTERYSRLIGFDNSLQLVTDSVDLLRVEMASSMFNWVWVLSGTHSFAVSSTVELKMKERMLCNISRSIYRCSEVVFQKLKIIYKEPESIRPLTLLDSWGTNRRCVVSGFHIKCNSNSESWRKKCYQCHRATFNLLVRI